MYFMNMICYMSNSAFDPKSLLHCLVCWNQPHQIIFVDPSWSCFITVDKDIRFQSLSKIHPLSISMYANLLSKHINNNTYKVI